MSKNMSNTSETLATTAMLEISLADTDTELKETSLGMGASLVVLSLVGTLGNGLVILSVTFCRKLWKPSNMYILSLAVTDFCLAAFVMPYEGFASIVSYIPIGCKVIGVLDFILLITSVFSLASIAVNRFLLVYLLPHIYLRYFSCQRTILSILCIWVLGICAALPLLLGTIPSGYDAMLGFCVGIPAVKHWQPKCSIYITVLSFVVGIPIILTILACYTGIWCIFKRNTMSEKSRRSTSGDSSVKARHRRFVVSRNLCILTIVFAICWVPTIVINSTKQLYTVAGKDFVRFAYLLCFANSVINPFLYLMNEQFRRSYLAVVHCQSDSTRPGQMTRMSLNETQPVLKTSSS